MIKHIFNDFEYFLNENPKNEQDLISISKIDSPPPPNELYHYYGLNKDGVSALTQKYIYANHPYHFNDPYDCYPELISFESCSLAEILELNDGIFEIDFLTKLYNSNQEKDKRELSKHLNYVLYNVIYLKTGIFCMTDKIDNIIMWSYYNYHQGFAVKYDTNDFAKTFWGPFPINYTETFEPIEFNLFKRASFIYQSNLKAKCWKPENEYRLIFYGPNTMEIPQQYNPNAHDRKFYHNLKAIKEIVFGFSFFSINEYDMSNSNESVAHVKVKDHIGFKRDILNFTINNSINISMIKIMDKGFGLKKYPAKIEMIAKDRYKISFN